jgi:hypothetical protein
MGRVVSFMVVESRWARFFVEVKGTWAGCPQIVGKILQVLITHECLGWRSRYYVWYAVIKGGCLISLLHNNHPS